VPKRQPGGSEALELAARALVHRDRSIAELRERLDRRGVPASERDEALATLGRSGVLDDERFASARAAALAERGYGDAAIAADLERRGIGIELQERALGLLEPEAERARTVVERRGGGPRTARYLVARGFGAEVVEAACGVAFAPDP
jgi:SOS response regulatory protein OraA/RecX